MAQCAVWEGVDLHTKHTAWKRGQSRAYHALVPELAYYGAVHSLHQRREENRIVLSPYYDSSSQQDWNVLSSAGWFQGIARVAEPRWISRLRHFTAVRRAVYPRADAIADVA